MEPVRPSNREGFEIAIICALSLEADAVEHLFDHYWDDDGGKPFDKFTGDPNSYSTGTIGRHNVVLAFCPGIGKVSAALVAGNCRSSFPNIRLGLVVGVAGIVPFGLHNEEIVLGDVIISDGIIQYDFGRQLPERFVRKDTLNESLGRQSSEIRAYMAKMKSIRGRKSLVRDMATYLNTLREEPLLAAGYPGTEHDKLFEPKYRHLSDKDACDQAGCNGELVSRNRLLDDSNPSPTIHFGLIACGDKVMKSGEERDAIAKAEGIIAFEMEGAGVWDVFPCVVIKSGCDYADSHKNKKFQRYAAATAAACTKAFLKSWVPNIQVQQATGNNPKTTTTYIIPYTRNTDFVPRDDILNQLKNRRGPLDQTDTTSQYRVALFGLGGVGKTQIALAFTYWYRETYPTESIFWIHASNAEQFRQSYSKIAKGCQITGHDDPKADVMVLVREWLIQSTNGRRWLLIIDNADDSQLFFSQQTDSSSSITNSVLENNQNFATYLPECAHGSIVITTRNKQLALRLAKGYRPIDIHAMSKTESQELLRTKLHDIEANPDELLVLAAKLEHLPLALVQSAAYIYETSITVAKYLELMGENDAGVVDLLSKKFITVGRDSDPQRAVAQTWMISFHQIERQHNLAARFLSFMSIFDRQDIPLQFLLYYCEDNEDETTPNELDVIEALGVLKAFSFITEKPNGAFNMHRLVQLVTRKWLTNSNTIPQFLEEALIVIENLYPECTFENREVCANYLPHADAVLAGREAIAAEEDETMASLLYHVATYLDFEGKWKDAERFYIKAKDICGVLYEADHFSVLIFTGRLAMVYRNQGRWGEAEKLQIQVLEARKIKLGPDHPDTLMSMNNLAVIYQHQGQWNKAEKLHIQATETRKVVLRPDHPDTLRSMNNLATTYKSQGRLVDAEGLHIQVMETLKIILGPNHPDTLRSMHNLARIYCLQGRLDEAEELQLVVTEASTVKLGADYPDTLLGVGSLASTYYDQGRYDEAEKLGIKILETHKSKFGPDHPHTLTSMNNLACTWRRQNRLDEALQLMREYSLACQRVLGPEHPDTLSSLDMVREWS